MAAENSWFSPAFRVRAPSRLSDCASARWTTGRNTRKASASGTIAKAARDMRGNIVAVAVPSWVRNWERLCGTLGFLRKGGRLEVDSRVGSPQVFILRLATTATIATATTASTAIVPPRSAEMGRPEEYDATDEPELDDEEPTVSGTDVE